MATIAAKIASLINEFYAQCNIVLACAFLIYGAILFFSEEGSEKLKKRAPLILIGAFLMFGSLALGNQYGATVRF